MCIRDRAIDRTRKFFGNHKLILSVDRLDYSKGILHRLWGFADVYKRQITYFADGFGQTGSKGGQYGSVIVRHQFQNQHEMCIRDRCSAMLYRTHIMDGKDM